MKNRLEFIFQDIGLDFMHDTRKQSNLYSTYGENMNSLPPKRGKCLTIVERKYLLVIIQHPHMHSCCQVSQFKLNQKVFVLDERVRSKEYFAKL